MEFSIDLKGVNELAARFKGAEAVIEQELTRSTTRLVLQGEANSKRLVRKKTRTLMRSISHRVTPIAGGVRGIWGTRLEYGPHIEFGTSAHRIVAKGRALKFSWKGRTVYFKSVNHPGSKAYPFIGPSFDAIKAKAPGEYRSALRNILKRLGG